MGSPTRNPAAWRADGALISFSSLVGENGSEPTPRLPLLQPKNAVATVAAIRCALTPAQEDSAIFRRKAIYEELHPETKAIYAGGGFKGNRHTGSLESDNLSFTSSTAEATGKEKRTVERAAARGKALGDDLAEIAGTSLDKGSELDALAKMNADDRREIVDRAKAGENVSARVKTAAAPLVDANACDARLERFNAQLERLMQAWNAAGPNVRQKFLSGIRHERGAP